MEKFERSGAWNLPVIEDGQYLGFVSKAKIFNAYRKNCSDKKKISRTNRIKFGSSIYPRLESKKCVIFAS